MSWDLHPWEGIRGKKDFTWAIPALKSSRLSHRLRPLVLGTSTGETSLLGWLEDTETNQRAVGSLDSIHEESAHAGWPTRLDREGSVLVATGFSTAMLYTLQPRPGEC